MVRVLDMRINNKLSSIPVRINNYLISRVGLLGAADYSCVARAELVRGECTFSITVIPQKTASPDNVNAVLLLMLLTRPVDHPPRPPTVQLSTIS